MKRYLRTIPVIALSLFTGGDAVLAQQETGHYPDSSVVPVRLVTESGRHFLSRGGKPYVVKGAGLGSGTVATVAAHGGNSVRTWTTNDERRNTLDLLDEAERRGVTVALCIDLGRERHGFDYDDKEAVARQLAYARAEVEKYRDHPALLLWIIGNEMNLSSTNPRVYDAINDVSKMIHEVDPNHPTTTALAGFNANLASLLSARAPDLDFVSVQVYAEIDSLVQKLEKIDYRAPVLITEWGATGHWEVARTAWGAPLEQNSSDKARSYQKRYESVIAARPGQVIGSYVFLWGQKQERTPTWYGMFLADGSGTESVDVMQYVWSGEWPLNRAPQILALTLNSMVAEEDVVLQSGERYQAVLETFDPDQDRLSFRWEIMRESNAQQEGGDREEVPETLTGLVEPLDGGGAVVTSPDEPGAYRLFAYVHDGNGRAGHANVPFLVRAAAD